MKSFSELTGREKSTELLRWICVPAAAVVGVLALRIIVGFVMPRAAAQTNGTYFVAGRVSGTALAAGFSNDKPTPRHRWLAPFRSR